VVPLTWRIYSHIQQLKNHSMYYHNFNLVSSQCAFQMHTDS